MADPLVKAPAPVGEGDISAPKTLTSPRGKLPPMKPVASHRQRVDGPTPDPKRDRVMDQLSKRSPNLAGMRKLRSRALD